MPLFITYGNLKPKTSIVKIKSRCPFTVEISCQYFLVSTSLKSDTMEASNRDNAGGKKEDDDVLILKSDIMEASNQDNSGDKKEDDDVLIYEKGVADHHSWKPAAPFWESDTPFLTFWKRHFRQLNLRLVEAAEQVPDNALNSHLSDYKTEYKGPHVVLVASDDVEKKAGDGDKIYYMAVMDSKDPKRAFVGQYIEAYEKMVGGICCFDESGNLDGAPEPFDEQVFQADCRDQKPAWDTVFLCGNTLSFLWSYRVTGFTKLNTWHLREDRLHGYSQHEILKEAPANTQILDGRWLCCSIHDRYYRRESTPDRYFCIDLESIRQGDKSAQVPEYTATLYDRVLLPGAMDLKTAIGSLQDVPLYDFSTRDGYPVRCIQCGGDTVEAKIMPQDWGLGLGVCPQCRIRYSNGGKVWKCWDMVNSATKPSECNCELSDAAPGYPYVCPNATNHVDGWVQDEESSRKKKPHGGKKSRKEQVYMEFLVKTEMEGNGGKKAKLEK